MKILLMLGAVTLGGVAAAEPGVWQQFTRRSEMTDIVRLEAVTEADDELLFRGNPVTGAPSAKFHPKLAVVADGDTLRLLVDARGMSPTITRTLGSGVYETKILIRLDDAPALAPPHRMSDQIIWFEQPEVLVSEMLRHKELRVQVTTIPGAQPVLHFSLGNFRSAVRNLCAAHKPHHKVDGTFDALCKQM